MRNVCFLTLTILLHAFALAFAPLAVARTPTDADLEEFRSDLGQVLQELDQHRATIRQNALVRGVLAQSKSKSSPPLEEVQQQLQQMTPEDLAQVYRGFTTAFPNWREAPRVLGRLASEIARYGAGNLEGPVAQAITPDNCQDAFNAAPSWTDWGITKAFEIAAQGAYEIILPPFNALVMAAWIPLAEGANAAEILNLIFERCQGDQDGADLATSIQTIITDIQSAQSNIINNDNANRTAITNNDNSNSTTIVNNLQTAVTNSQTAITQNDNTNKNTIVANDNSNKEMILDDLSAAQSAIITSGDANSAAIVSNDNINKNTIVANDNSNTTNVLNTLSAAQTAIVNNDNANTAAIVNNDNANKNELRDLTLRTQIEQDLAEADSATQVALFLTPTANGGHLDLVQTIVTETLANIQAAGGDIGDAQSFLTQADAEKAAGQFKEAYKSYRKAYKAAVK